MSTETTATSPAPPPCPLLRAPARALSPGDSVRFIGGRYNGLTGTLRLCGPSIGAIMVLYDNRPCEVLEELRFCRRLSEWAADKSAAELQLRGAGDLAPAS